jgi:drug/metabolite transporter (DMT)-like permease
MLEGLKTYVVIAVAILSAILGYFNDQLTGLQALEAIGLALALGGNRAVVWAGQVLNSPYGRLTDGTRPNPTLRNLTTYVGVVLAILTAVLAAMNGEQDSSVTIGVILGALGLNFLGLGAKAQAEGETPTAALPT